MRVAIDSAGRLVLPKPLRAELGISGPGEVDIVSAHGHLELSVPEVPAHVELRDGLAVIVPDAPMPRMSAKETRDALERVRR
jgi:bifunctional DNA-binding transcriptional regulator/antitoxin component of YhaV-PrlF toxin-antitoxin module